MKQSPAMIQRRLVGGDGRILVINTQRFYLIRFKATLQSGFFISEIIAEGVGNQHKSVIELVRKYQSDLEEFGMVAFQTRARLQGTNH